MPTHGSSSQFNVFGLDWMFTLIFKLFVKKIRNG